MALPQLVAAGDPGIAVRDSGRWDAVVVVTPTLDLPLAPLQGPLKAAAAVDARVGQDVTLILAPSLAGGRLVVAPTGPLSRDVDDVRRFADAARAGVARARDAGAIRPLLYLPRRGPGPLYDRALEVALLGALAGLWEPLEAREAHGESVEPVRTLGFSAPELSADEGLIEQVTALETGRRLARDLGGAEPERMNPIVFAESCRAAFHGSPVGVSVIDDEERLALEYPLLYAVARASLGVSRHRPAVVRLEYVGEGPIEETLLLAGKGLVYDTGGADLKVSGAMAGMSRDKCGAATVAGLFRTLAALRPRRLRVVAELGLVRNSIGPDAFVTDEILVSHAGVRVRVGNTDAEGRLVLADLLSHLREAALKAKNPRVFSVATLTGHASRAVGPYPIAMDNGPARALGVASGLAEQGERWGEPFELSRLRREDMDFVKPRSKADDVLSCNNAPSSLTARGHQFPMAFLLLASGLAKHGGDGAQPLPYTHIDLGGCAAEGGDWQHGRPTAIPLVALAARWASRS